MASMVLANRPNDCFALPLSIQAYEEYEQIETTLQQLNLNDQYDSRSFIWGSNTFTSAKFYKFMFNQFSCDPCIKSIWLLKCLPKLKVFLWLLCYNRLNTKVVIVTKELAC